MKRRDIDGALRNDGALRKAGWIIEHGTRHDFAKHPQKPGIRIQLPRHTEANENTANGILKAAGLQ